MLSLIACTQDITVPEEKKIPIEETQQIQEEVFLPEQQTSEITQEQKEEQLQEQTQEKSQELQRLLEKSKEINNYEYSYTAPPYKQSEDMTYIKGDKMRINLMQSYNTETLPYTTIFIDWKENTALGYCLLKFPRCKDDKVTVLDTKLFKHPTPLDWVKEVEKYGTFVHTSKLVQDKKTKGVTFLFNEKEHTAYLDVFGMPVRVEIGPGGEKGSYNYNRLVINSVREEYVTAP